MDIQKAKKRILKLRQTINSHNYKYHVLDKPELTDAAFDSLKRELADLEDQFPDFITKDSPTQRVSGKALDKFTKVIHKTRMLSLEDAFSEEELYDWYNRIKKLVPNKKPDFFAEYKVDGFAIALIYKNGIMVDGSTRGNGQIGEDVTQNLRTIESIPLSLEIRQKLPNEKIKRNVERLLNKGEIEIRGEVYMATKAFKDVNKERARDKLPLYANPRNTAAGSIRQLDPKIAAARQLHFLAYGVVSDVGQITHQQEHQIALALGFKTDIGDYCANLDQVVSFWKKVKKTRESLEFQIDGVVVNVNNIALFQRLGVVGKAPRGALALKFPAKEATTVVEDIKVQVGRTGALTPVAIVRPVNIGGTKVTRATLHNEDEIKKLDVRIGDTVIIQRAGDVIPDITKVLVKMRSGKERPFKMPQRCPFCNSEVIRPAGEAVHRCTNKRCGARQKRSLGHFVSRQGFDIVGLGPKIINQLMDSGLVSDYADLFFLKVGDLEPLERFAEKSVANLIAAIQKSKIISLPKFIYALGIRHVGEETAFDLARELVKVHKNIFGMPDFINAVKKFMLSDLQNIQDIGPVVGSSIYNFFQDNYNKKLLYKLAAAQIEIVPPKIKFSSKLKGKAFVLTGELNSLTRIEAKQKIRDLGGEVLSSVSKNTDFVIAGNEPGSNYSKAKKLNIKILTENKFIKLFK